MLKFKLKLPQEINPVLAQFHSPDLEYAYRQYYFNHDKIQVICAIMFPVLLLMLFFATSDYQLLGNSWQYYALSASRIVFLLASVASSLILWQSKRINIVDWTICAWLMVATTSQLYVNSTRPPDYAFHFAIHLLTLFAIYVLLPNRLLLQLLPALYLTGGSVGVLWFGKVLSPLLEQAVLMAILMGNLLGLGMSWYLQVNRRTHFSLLMNEKRLKEDLKRAAENIKILTGLLPICASCKKIRDDKGYWHQVEVYIRDHSEAEFSHGICPECAKRLYPEFYKLEPDKEEL
jgi:hypothetical protein